MSTTYPRTFDKILIANRGEIARRVIKTCKKMGIYTVAVYSDPDRHSMFVSEADIAYRIGPAASAQSYLDQDAIMKVIQDTGAQAVHPGYGFLSENSTFCNNLEKHNVTFIGPSVPAIQAMGDKIASKKLARDSKVNTVPGFLGTVNTDDEVRKIANDIGYPVMIKASAGGGGKGMRIAWNDQEAIEGYKLSKDEAKNAFGDDRVFIEKYIEQPRHIEFQIIADKKGNTIYMPERECSVQRRNQKVVEESPSTLLTPEVRRKMGEQACAMAKSCKYHTTGTVEFLVDKNLDFYFLEMNTRLQVEHPVTEEITGIDLVEEMIKIAAGHDLQHKQEDVKINGWATELRVYAEDPSNKQFLPSIGFLRKYAEPKPHPNIRIDTGVEEGSEISMYYDPMISKLIAWGETRDESINLLADAIDEYVIHGVVDNLGFGNSIIRHPDYASGNYDTNFIPKNYPEGFTGEPITTQEEMLLAMAAAKVRNYWLGLNVRTDQVPAHQSKWFVHMKDGKAYEVDLQGDLKFQVTCLDTGETLPFKIHDFEMEKNTLIDLKYEAGDALLERLHELTFQWLSNTDMDYSFKFKGGYREMRIFNEREWACQSYMPPPKVIDYGAMIISPMPGKVISVDVEVGDEVEEGQEVMIIEAMKMQNLIKAERRGVIKAVNVAAGASVDVDEVLIEFED